MTAATPAILTADQIAQLKVDSVVSEGSLTLADLGIQPTAAEVILPNYLARFRRGGRFAGQRKTG